jgi:iron complex transport system ATP-binding protein
VLSGFFAGLGLARHNTVTPKMQKRALDALEQVEALSLAEKPLDRMSTGEVRRVLIARALVNDPRALLLDEPTTGLDIAACRRFLETLRGLAQRGRTILLVTHHVEEIIPEIESVVLIQEGRVFQEGTKSEVLTSRNLSELFGARITVRESGGYFGAVAG